MINFPYTNFHRLNADWMISAIKNFMTNAKNATASAKTGNPVSVTVSGDGVNEPYNFDFTIPDAIEVNSAVPRIIDTCNPPVITGLEPCAGDGVTDDTTALQSIIDYAIANGWAVQLTGKHRITGPVTISGPIVIRGIGCNYTNYDAVTQNNLDSFISGLLLDADGEAIRIPGRVSGVVLANFAVHHMQSGYSIGIAVNRLMHSLFENLTISWFSRGLSLAVDSGAEYANDNCMFNTFRDINLNRCGMNSSSALYLDGFTGNLYGGNVCHCLFERINIENVNHGCELNDCDNNTFIGIRVYNRPGSDWSLIFGTKCRGNFMYHIQSPRTLVGATNSGHNYINGFSYENGESAPYVQEGSTGSLTVVNVDGVTTTYTAE